MENVILFGNGLNLLNGEKKWNDILQDLLKSKKDLITGISNTLQYEDIYLSKDVVPVIGEKYNETTEYWLKKDIADSFSHYRTNAIYKELVQMPIVHYMTTNYDHAIDDEFQKTDYIKSSEKSENSETIYSIRRRHCMIKSGSDKNKVIWKIHGDTNAPRSIMLGYDHYCGQIAKMNSYIKGTYENSVNKETITKITERIKAGINVDASVSWIDFFFAANVYILGLKLDFDEIDLWWLLNKRIRLKREGKAPIFNKIHFYDCDISNNKRELMHDFGVEVHAYPKVSEDGYMHLYKQIIKDIQENIKG